MSVPSPAQPSSTPATKTFYAASAALFLSAAAATVWFSRSMSMTMPMPGDWNMSMMWMELASGSPWPAFAFIAMWVAMMVAMMLPSTLPVLLLYRRVAVFRGDSHLAFRTWLLAAGYFAAWAIFGAVVCVGGALIAHVAMASDNASQAMPALGGLALIVAGVYQLTPWKSACLRHCRDPFSLLSQHIGPRFHNALTLGLHHGAFCAACCWGLMLIQIVLGVMNIYVMVVIALVIALEKLLVSGHKLTRWIGAAAIVAGGILLTMAVLNGLRGR